MNANKMMILAAVIVFGAEWVSGQQDVQKQVPQQAIEVKKQEKDPAKIYVRYKIDNVDLTYAKLKQVLHYDPWSFLYPAIPENADKTKPLKNAQEDAELFTSNGEGKHAPVTTGSRVRAKQYSPWAEVRGSWSTVVLSFFNNEHKALENTEVELQFATSLDPKSIFFKRVIKEKGNIVSISFPRGYLGKLDEIRTVREESEKHLQMAKSLNLSREKLPKQMTFYTGFYGHKTLYTDIEIWKNELKTLVELGINMIYMPNELEHIDAAKELGITKFTTHNYSGDTNAVIKLKQKIGEENFNLIKQVCLADEPNNFGLSSVPARQPGDFANFLQRMGLQLADFNVNNWDDVSVMEQKSELEKLAYNWGPKYGQAFKKLFYWSNRYSQDALIRHYRIKRERMEPVYPPGTIMFVNYTDHPLILGGKMLPGNPDWFELALQKAMTAQCTEDWMYSGKESWGGGLYQRMAFLCDILRLSGAKHNLPLVFYNTMDSELGIRMKGLIVIAHGAKIIDYFMYGPTYAATENYWSDNISQYKGVAKVIRDIAKAEEMIYPGMPPKREVAIIYSTTDEIWASSSYKGHEKQYLHIALAQDFYPADVLNETLTMESDLNNYKVIYFMDKYFPTACIKKLREYVEKGGTLVLMPGAGEKNEYDEDVDILKGAISIKAAVTAVEDTMNKMINIEGKQSEVYISNIRAELSGGKMLGQFSDGSAAIVMNELGRGKVVYYSFLPGHNFKAFVNILNENVVSNFSADARFVATLPCRITNVKRDVEINGGGTYEANLLVSPQGKVLILVNLERNAIERIDLKVAASGVKNVESVENGIVKFEERNGYVYFSMPMTNLTDIVMIKCN